MLSGISTSGIPEYGYTDAAYTAAVDSGKYQNFVHDSAGYYSTQRPVGPGTFPKPQGNAVKEVFNFDSKTYCEEVGREAWGYIEYEKPLDPETAAGYRRYPHPNSHG